MLCFFLPHCVFSVAYNNASKTTTHVNALSHTHTHINIQSTTSDTKPLIMDKTCIETLGCVKKIVKNISN